MRNMVNTREEAREMFASSGLRYEHITPEDLAALRRKLSESFKASDLLRGSLRIIRGGKKDIGPEGVRFAQILCASDYFESREAVTFNSDGLIGFAGWADNSNVAPILAAFTEWTRETAALKGLSPRPVSRDNKEKSAVRSRISGGDQVSAFRRPAVPLEAFRPHRVRSETHRVAAEDFPVRYEVEPPGGLEDLDPVGSG